jgi:hypothetical protein
LIQDLEGFVFSYFTAKRRRSDGESADIEF